MYIPENYQAYRTAIESPGRPPDYVYGTITFVDQALEPLDIDATNMPQNAISISSQCVDDNALMFGGVFTSVLKLSVLTTMDRYVFYNARIELFYDITIGYNDDEEQTPIYETIPLGVFYVTDADRHSGGTVNLTAYDSMTLLDVELGSVQINGTPWKMFEIVSSITGYQLDFTEGDLATYPNYDKEMSASEQDGIQTYRDVVKEICQQLGCFAMDNRGGKLKIKQFSKTPDLVLGAGDWYSMVPADYQCSYIGVSITGKSGTYEKFDEDHPDRVGLIWTIPDAPAWDYGTENAQEERTAAIYDLVVGNEEEEIPGIEYTPASIDMPSDATFECGDMLELIPYNSGTDDHIFTIITSIEWNFHNGMDIESVGINPRIEGSSAAASSTNRLVNQSIEKSKIQFLSVVNNATKTVSPTAVNPTQLCEFHFTPTALADSLFLGTFLINASVDPETETSTNTETVEVPVKAYNDQSEEVQITDKDGNIVDHLTAMGTNTFTYTYLRDGKCEATIYYVLDDIILPANDNQYLAKATLENGKHIVSLTYPLNNLAMGHTYHFEVYIIVSGGTLTIPEDSIRATLFGQEIDVISNFDGFIDINEDPTGFFSIGNITPLTFYEDEDNISVTTAEAAKCIATDTISLYNIASISVKTLYEGTNEYAPQIYLETVPITTEDGTRFCTEDEVDFFTDDNEEQSGE